MFNFRQFIDFSIFGRHRLERIQMLPLGSTIVDAIKLYGEPLEKEPSEEAPEITQYSFEASPYHGVTVSEWEDKVQSIVYWSAKGDPTRDLNCMLRFYEEDSEWELMEKGYWYQRVDRKVRLWCSAIPAIGIAYVDFLSQQAALNTKHNIQKLAELDDITWAPSNALFALQRQFVEGKSQALLDLARRSDRFFLSADGKDLFILCKHGVKQTPDGFVVQNTPPEHAGGDSAEVISWFNCSEDSSFSSHTTLPRDAQVEFLRCTEDQWHLEVRQTTTNRILTFHGPANKICSLGTHEYLNVDAEIWAALEEEATASRVEDGPPPITGP